jgi:hypothetical protein
MNITSKTIYYWIIIVIGLISTLLTLNIIRSRNKYPSSASIKNILTLYINKFYNLYNPNKIVERAKYVKNIDKLGKELNIKENITMYTYPFNIQFIEDENKKFNLIFNQKENILYLHNINSISKEEYDESLFSDFLSKFGLSINSTFNANETLVNIKNNLPIYRSINIFIWIPDTEMEKTKKYYNYIDTIQKETSFLNSIGPIIVKFIVYDSKNGIKNNQDLYTDIKNYNGKRLFDELNDADLFNIHIFNEKETNDKISTLYNDDLNSFLFGIDFDKNINKKIFIHIVKYLQFLNLFPRKKNIFSASYMNNNILNELIKLFNHPYNMNHLKFLAIMNNIEKISRIFPLYESILTIDKVKQKIDKILNFLKNAIKNNFDENSLNNVDEIYVDTLYLMNSNELVIFEHFFSNEFKLGQFLPIMAPIFYILFKSIKALTY